MDCAVCGASMVPDLTSDTFRCRACGFFASVLPVRINAAERIDEDARERALKPIRLANFKQLLDECAAMLPRGTKLLDIGCAHGWFMEAAAVRSIVCRGIEPDREMGGRAAAAGHDVVDGYFPQDMPCQEKYDAIIFNDVFEHLPDVNGIARVLPDYLQDGGIVLVNLPVTDGLIFRLCRAAARFGVGSPLDRMWQRGLPSPHLSYFTEQTLLRVFERAGFGLILHGALQSVEKEGLYKRIRYDRAISPIRAALLYAAARFARKMTGFFPSDIQYFVFRQPTP